MSNEVTPIRLIAKDRLVPLTRSQQMAILDILLAYARLPNEPQIFVDILTDTHTTTGDLLLHFTNAEPRDMQAEMARYNLATATGTDLDRLSELMRLPGEPDEAFRKRIQSFP
jgi:hypothetical protein